MKIALIIIGIILATGAMVFMQHGFAKNVVASLGGTLIGLNLVEYIKELIS